MSDLRITICRESGICSLIKSDGRADLLPDETEQLQSAGDELEQIRKVIAGADSKFAESLHETELRLIAAEIAE
jgi:hypothetical protein